MWDALLNKLFDTLPTVVIVSLMGVGGIGWLIYQQAKKRGSFEKVINDRLETLIEEQRRRIGRLEEKNEKLKSEVATLQDHLTNANIERNECRLRIAKLEEKAGVITEPELDENNGHGEGRPNE